MTHFRKKTATFTSLLFITFFLISLSTGGKTAQTVSEKNLLMGKFSPQQHPDFRKVHPKYLGRSYPMYLHRDAYQAFQKMHAAAAREGITLRIISATRNFVAQKSIWEGKWNGSRIVEGKNISTLPPLERALTILRYSSMPGTSRHHWGTDFDLNSLNNAYFNHGQGKKIYTWLRSNAAKFGFCQPYTAKDKDRPFGYEMEKWHWSYRPLSRQFLERYMALITDADLTGFAGSSEARSVQARQHYVNGIASECR